MRDLLALVELVVDELGCWPGSGIHAACDEGQCWVPTALRSLARAAVTDAQQDAQRQMTVLQDEIARLEANERQLREMLRGPEV